MGAYAIQIITAFLLLLIVVIFLRATASSVKYEKRISRFALISRTDDEMSLFDSFFGRLWNFIHSFSNLLRKNIIFRNIGKGYEKHIPYEKSNYKHGTDFLAIKFLLGITLVFCELLSSVIRLSIPNVTIVVIAFLFGFFVADIIWYTKYNLRNKRVNNDLLRVVITMNNALKSGSSIIQAIEIINKEFNGPIKEEFSKILLDIKYGLSIENAFERFANRVKSKDVRYIASAIGVGDKTGGNVINVFSGIQKYISNKRKIENEYNSITAGSFFMYRFLTVIPIIFIISIFILSPDYFRPLFTNFIGILSLTLLVSLYFLYIAMTNTILRGNRYE